MDTPATGIRLELHNPTQHDARVSILAETAAQAATPLGHTALIKWPKVPVKARSTAQVNISPDGSVQSD